MQWAAQKLGGSMIGSWMIFLEGFITVHLMASVCSHCYYLNCLKEENKNEKKAEKKDRTVNE